MHVLVGTALAFGLVSGLQAGEDGGRSAPAHAEFIRQSLRQLIADITAEVQLPLARGVNIVPAHRDSANPWLDSAAIAEGDGRREDAPRVSYHVHQWEFSLVKKTRRSLLGPFWVLRRLRIGVSVDYPPDVTRAGIARREFFHTAEDWVRAVDLAGMNTGQFAGLSIPPATDFVSRWAAPVLVSAGLGLVTYLFFAVR